MSVKTRHERGKHRRDDEHVEVSARVDVPDMGILAHAAALQESGILVHALSVTDLSSGFNVSGTGATEADPFLAREGAPRFRGSEVGLESLEMLRELVVDVMDHRRAHPEYSQVDAPGGRTQFPWGVGMTEPDVLIAGMHAGIIAEYLRCTGMRARVLDVERALRIAADLRDVEQDLEFEAELVENTAQPSGSRGRASVESKKAHQAESELTGDELRAEADEPNWDAFEEKRADQRTTQLLVAAAVLLVCLVGVGSAFALSSSSQSENVATSSDDATAESSSATTSQSSPEQTQPPGGMTSEPKTEPPQPAWREQHVAGDQVVTASAERAEVPVKMDAPGWRRSGATAKREEFMSNDPDMRVLVSAVATPLGTQEQLDAAVLKQLEGMKGIRVAGRAPVSYEEIYPDSTTLWHVRLMEGHQVSVGCQFREVTGQRLRECDAAVNAAGVDFAHQ